LDNAVKTNPADPRKRPSEKGRFAQREIRVCATCGTKFFGHSESGICLVCILLGSASEQSGVAEALIPAAIEERQILTFQDLQNVPPADLCSVWPRLTPSGPEKVSLGPKNLIAKRTE
jgi:hypothetical protein